MFLLLLGLNASSWLTAAAALAIPLIREDTGVVLIGLALAAPAGWGVRRWP